MSAAGGDAVLSAAGDGAASARTDTASSGFPQAGAPRFGSIDAVREGLAEGLVLNAVAPGALRLAPPLTISDDEIDEGARRLGAALARLAPA